MNRRLFLTGTGTVAAYSAYHWVKPRRAYAQASGALDYDIVSACTNNHTITIADAFNQNYSGDAWRNVQAAHLAMRSDVGSKGLDDNFKQAVQSFAAANIDFSTVDWNAVLSNIQMYQPAFQMSDLSACLSILPQDPGTLANTLYGLQQGGITTLLNTLIDRSAAMAQFCDNVGGGGGGGGGPVQQGKKTGPVRNLYYIDPPENTGYNCQIDGAVSAGLGIAMAVLAVMAGPAGVLAMAFWEGIVLWGGIAAGAWTAGHISFCGF